MKYFPVLVALIVIVGSVCAQIPERVWIEEYDFRQSPDDWYGVNHGVFTSHNDFILIGYALLTADHGQLFLMKIDMDGDTIWTKTLGNTLTHDVGIDIIETSDGNIMALGIVQFDGNFGRIRLYKMTPGGDVVWERTYLAETEYAWGYGIAETSDGGLAITGESESDMFVLRTDSNGDSLWFSRFGGDYHDAGAGIAPTADGGAIAVGYISTADMKFDSLVVVRVGPAGNELWMIRFPFGDRLQHGASAHIYQDRNENYILTAAPDFGPVYSYKLGADGTVLWSSDMDQYEYVMALDACEGSDNTAYITGGLDTDMHTVVGKIDSNGDSLLLTTVILSENSIGNFIYQDDNGHIYIGGRLLASHTLYFAEFKESPPADIAEDCDIIPSEYRLFQNCPNPFNPSTVISFSLPRRSHVSIMIFNPMGQMVANPVEREFPAGRHQVIWNGRDAHGHEIAAGIYLYRLKTGDYRETKKMVLLK